tara:strand:- start:87 stop:215 length:129 start_codon:yes stop_codon:yes gene_type:complete
MISQTSCKHDEEIKVIENGEVFWRHCTKCGFDFEIEYKSDLP